MPYPSRAFVRILIWSLSGLAQMASAQPVGQPTAYRMELPGRGWALEVDLPGFTIDQEEIQPRAEGMRMLGHKGGTGMTVSMFLEQRPRPVTSQSCRDVYWTTGKNSPSKKTNLELSDPGPMSMIKWLTPDHQGIAVNQQHMFGFLGRENICAEIHLSKVNFQPGEEQLFGEVLRSVRMVAAGPPPKTASRVPGGHNRTAYRFTVSKHQRLKLELDPAWRAGMQQHPNGTLSTIRIWPNDGERFEVLISRIPRKSPNEPVTSTHLRSIVQETGQKAVLQSVEQKLELKELGPGKWTGYYYRLTDKAPGPREYKYLTQGVMSDGMVLFTFTFLTNSDKSADQQEVLRLLTTAQLEL